MTSVKLYKIVIYIYLFFNESNGSASYNGYYVPHKILSVQLLINNKMTSEQLQWDIYYIPICQSQEQSVIKIKKSNRILHYLDHWNILKIKVIHKTILRLYGRFNSKSFIRLA